jgi:O-antigen ligase
MRRVAWGLLLVFVFTIPWEYSLELGAPLGNIARVTGLGLLLIAIPATLQSGRLRRPGLLQLLAIALYLWFCLSYLWTIEPQVTFATLRSYFQEFMIVWLVWEFAEDAGDLFALMRAWLAGSAVLAVLTYVGFASAADLMDGHYRFVAVGQDPNDAARYLFLGFPVAAFLIDVERGWLRLAAAIYIPLGLAAVLLTASRSGFLCALVALAGCAVLLLRNHARVAVLGGMALPLVVLVVWSVAPHGTLGRLGTILEQVQTGDLNQRLNIWGAGWRAFVLAPLIGHGAGSFVTAAGLAPIDTAHNTLLSVAVEGGLWAACIAAAIFFACARLVMTANGTMRTAMATLLVVLVVASLTGTVLESRSTWLALSLISLSGRISCEASEIQFVRSALKESIRSGRPADAGSCE